MKATHQIDHQQRIIFAVWSGIVTHDEAMTAAQSLLADREFNPHYNRVYDVRGVTEAHLTKASLMELAQIDPIYPSERRAVIATSPSIFGMGRMYGLLTGKEEKGSFRVVANLQQAIDWFNSPQ
ncbi:MAG: hypothetical protein ABIQ35_08400 [Verrucomicrobiota bacterium]